MEKYGRNSLEEMLTSITKHRDNQDNEGVFEYAMQLYKQAEKEKDVRYKGIACYHISNYNYIQGQYEKAKEYVMECLQLFNIHNDTFYQIMALNLAGIIYGAIKDEITSVSYMLKAYYMSIEKNELTSIYIILNNLGVIFMNLKYYDIAIRYFLESFEFRHINSYDDMKSNTGFNIINIYGCYVHLNKEAEINKWLPYYEEFAKRYKNSIVELDFAFYQIYIAYYHKGDVWGKIDNFMKEAKRNNDKLHVVKNEIQLFDICIELKNKIYCERLLKDIHEILQLHPMYRKGSILNSLKVRYYRTFHMEKEYQNELKMYYEINELEKKENEHIMKQTLLTKIELENTLFHQSEIIKKNEELSRNIELEEFTMLLNKTSFQKYVEDELRHIHKDQYICLLLIDIDNFKEINDQNGHLYGDKILLIIAEILRNNVRTTDYVGRIGGDEFCIFMKNVLSLDYLEEVANRLTQEFHKVEIKNGGRLRASLGICITKKEITYEDMFCVADTNMYKAKHTYNKSFHIEFV